MATATARRSASAKPARKPFVRNTVEVSPRADIYEEVTAKIIAQLEAGRCPWVQPWQGNAGGPAMPHNAASGRRYNGVNVLLLWMAQLEAGYSSGGWMTFNQARDLGACVRKGERATAIVFASTFTPGAEKEKAAEAGEEARMVIPFLKRHSVFNVAQIDGLPDRFSVEPELVGERETIDAAEALIAASGVEFRVGGDKAFYVPSMDYIMVPDQRRFADQINYYRTACHELTHATGHHSRLDRKLLTIEGLTDRAREELVAEMGSAFLLATLGIVPTVNHADYIGSWLEVLKGDKRAIFRAASAATKASDWLLSRVEG